MIAAAIAKHLAGLGLVTFDVPDSDCALEQLPADPVNAVAVKTLPGPNNGLEPYGWVQVQLLVRTDGTGGRARSGHDRMMGLKDALHGLRHVTLDPGGVDEVRLIVAVAASDEPVDIGPDKLDRPRWSLIFDLQVAFTDGRRVFA